MFGRYFFLCLRGGPKFFFTNSHEVSREAPPRFGRAFFRVINRDV